MAMNPYLATLMQKIGPALERMPQLGQNTQFASQRPPPQGLFGPGMVPPQRRSIGMASPIQRQLPQLPQIAQAMPRRRFQGSGTMPRLDLSQLTRALQGAPGFTPAPTMPAPVAPAPVAPVVPSWDTNGTLVGGNPFVGYTGGPMNPAQIAANSGWTPELGNLFAHNP